jgi:D-hexose-6-phosphate mutarotase
VFPQFGTNGPLPQHGFARTAMWDVEECVALQDVSVAWARMHASTTSPHS